MFLHKVVWYFVPESYVTLPVVHTTPSCKQKLYSYSFDTRQHYVGAENVAEVGCFQMETKDYRSWREAISLESNVYLEDERKLK
jgi:hypothetical protein